MTLSEFINSSKSDTPYYLLFGHPVEHSWSPLMHNMALEYYNIDARYYAIDLLSSELSDLASFLYTENFKGANITIPYKQMLFDYMDEIEPFARQIGAINTILKQGQYLKGANTDFRGFLHPLKDYTDHIEGFSATVFGTGGASKAIVVGLLEMGIEKIFMVSRSPGTNNFYRDNEQVQIVSYHNWTSFLDEVALIVNATPLGMHPSTDRSPVRDAEQHWLADRICYDIVYNPIQTKFLTQASEAGAQTIDGLEMLIQQGSESFKLWTGNPFPADKIRDTLYEKLEN